MRSFVLPAIQPCLAHLVVEIGCALIALVSLWRFEASVVVLLVASIAASALVLHSYRTHIRKPRCLLLINKDGSFIALHGGKEHEAQLVFALCSTNRLLLRARVTIDGCLHRQEWQLRRTDNEAFWRLSCRWVQWLSSQGETKKPH